MGNPFWHTLPIVKIRHFLALALLVTAFFIYQSHTLDAQQPAAQGPNAPQADQDAAQGENETLQDDPDSTEAENPTITEEDIIRANYGMRRSGEGIQFELLNDFENCEDWRAYSTSPLGETRVRKVEGKPDQKAYDNETKLLEEYRSRARRSRLEKAQEFSDSGQEGDPAEQPADQPAADPAAQPAEATGDPAGQPADAAGEQENLDQIASDYILGVKTYFKDRGFDRVEIAPPNEYIIRGRAKEIRVWVLGRKYRHTMYVKLRDYRGRIHKLKMGNLDYFGWRKLKVTIPGWLPQSSRYALLDKNLHFVSFFVVSDNFESPGVFYLYLDNFSVVTDTAENNYDGSQILDTW